MIITDYTIVPVGAKIGDDLVVVCPHCFKHALSKLSNPEVFDHSLEMEIGKDGGFSVNWRSCPSKGSHIGDQVK